MKIQSLFTLKFLPQIFKKSHHFSKYLLFLFFFSYLYGYSQTWGQNRYNKMMAQINTNDTTNYQAHEIDSTVSKIPALRIGIGVATINVFGYISYFNPKACMVKVSYGTELPGNKIFGAEGWIPLASTSKMKLDKAVLKPYILRGYYGSPYGYSSHYGSVDLSRYTQLPCQHIRYYAIHGGYFTRDFATTPSYPENEPKAFPELAIGGSIIWVSNMKYIVTAPNQTPKTFRYQKITSLNFDILYYPTKPVQDTTGFAENLLTPIPTNGFSPIGVRLSLESFHNWFYYELAVEDNTYGFAYLAEVGINLSILENNSSMK
ncbi:MAG: hypothetical protein ACLQQ4_15475 [Bacteroidia bacterium]